MSSEEDLLNADAEPWKPEVGDFVIGQLIKTTYIEGNYQPYPMYEVLTDDGKVIAVHAFHRVLASEMTEQLVQEGDRFGVKYLGKPEGKSYEMYRVVVFKRANVVTRGEPKADVVPLAGGAHLDPATGEILPPEYSEEPF